jgi:uncharacterized membrane protein
LLYSSYAIQVFDMKNLNVALAIGLHCLVGAIFAGFAQYADFGDAQMAVAGLLWFGGLLLILDFREKSPGGVWLAPLVWPFAAWFTALGVVILLGGLVWLAVQSRASATPPRPAAAPMSAYESKLFALESTLDTLEAQLRDLIATPRPAPAAAVPPAPPPASAFTPAVRTPAPRRPSFERELDWSDLLGARALAWAGGVVTVLGILFFFVLAANRGWLLPEIRVALGATTSAALFGAGFWARRRFGSLYAAVSAAGAGIAGAYATLLAATALYEFVPEPWALVAAAGIAAAGALTALAWSSQTVAGLGLIGAILVPLMAFVEDGELSFVGTSFVALMLAATAVVALRTGWRELMLLAGAASLVQIAALTAQAEGVDWRVFWLASSFWLLYLGVGLAWQLLRGSGGIEAVSGVFVITGGALATYASLFLLDERAGYGLLAVAAFYGLLAAGFLRLEPYRDLSSVLGAVSLVVGAIAGGVLLSGRSLTFVWCAVAILLAWLAGKARESRLLLPALAYAALAVGYALAVEAEPRDLFVETPHPGSGALAIAAAAASLSLFAFFAGRQVVSVSETPLGRALDLAVRLVCDQARVYFWAAGALVLYAASLGVLELFVRTSDFDWGHTALAGLWASVALGLVATGVRVGRGVDIGGLALLALAAVEVVAFDSTTLDDTAWGTSFLLVASAGALAGFEYGRLSPFEFRLIPGSAAAVVSAILAIGGVEILADGEWHGVSTQGGALVLVAAVYAALAVPIIRAPRDLSTIYWSIALAIATGALTLLVADFWLVLAGAAGATALVLLARLTAETRLELAGAAAFVLTGVYVLGSQAPPEDLFTVTAHPGGGAPSMLVLLAAALVGAFTFRRQPLRLAALWTAGGLALYATSLGVLELFVRVSDFGWGHVALAGLWGTVALAALEAALRRNRLDLQVAAGALLTFAAIELGYDWDQLGSHTKAAIASLAVAAAALGAGIEYGRLAQLRERLVPAGVALAASAGLTALALATLGSGTWHRIDVVGGLFVLAGAVYAGLCSVLFRRERDLAPCLWGIGLGFAVAGAALLVDGFWLVLAGAAGAAALYLLGEIVREPRLQVAAAAVYVLSLGYALVVEAPPREFFVESAHPGSGVPALLALAASAAIVFWRPEPVRHARAIAIGIAGALCFYAVSLALLELAEIATDADVGTKFQRGHTAVTIFWGLVSLGFLYAGLKRRSWQLRTAGFALFGVSLAKLFLYDLAFLSPLTRALSFVVVGAVLLFAGFFYQRLSEQLEGRGGTSRAA